MENTTIQKETLMTHHTPRNVNRVQAAEMAAAGFNTQLAVWLTEHVGTMWTAYAFAVLAIIGPFAILGLLSPIVALLIAWISQTFLQLVLLPVIMVGQNVQGRHTEIRAELDFEINKKAEQEVLMVLRHLERNTELILQLMRHLQCQVSEEELRAVTAADVQRVAARIAEGLPQTRLAFVAPRDMGGEILEAVSA